MSRESLREGRWLEHQLLDPEACFEKEDKGELAAGGLTERIQPDLMCPRPSVLFLLQ